jgi:hypothetical protein
MYDRLVSDFSRDLVFKDVDSIPLSVPFPNYLRARLQEADVMLVLIGPSGSTARMRLEGEGLTIQPTTSGLKSRLH